MDSRNYSIVKEFYRVPEKLIDRKELTGEQGVDIIIPVFNTNEFFERNLFNFYERIPINRLLIGDGGCTDDTIEIAKKFPRVEIIDQHKFHTLGFCLKDLITHVETEYFLYLHADVFLPENWYDTMIPNKKSYDWFDCSIRNTVIIEVSGDSDKETRGTLPGTHVGRTSILKEATGRIDDDFVYRNEDFVIKEGVIKNGGHYGSIFDTCHYHQIINKGGEKEPKLESVEIKKKVDPQYEIKTLKMQVKGNIKYLSPDKRYVKNTFGALSCLMEYQAFDWKELKTWIMENNPEWLKHISPARLKAYYFLRKTRNKLFRR